MLKTLPSSSFIGARLKKLAKPRVLWSRNDNIAEDIVKQGSACIPLDGESESAYLKESMKGWVDRYGGYGIGVNGGAGRGAWVNAYQIKGIGRTALAGRDAPFWHSYGGVSAREAVRDAIWGEVFALALPHGAIKVEAIVLTDTSVPLQYPDACGNLRGPRALILRKPFLRLAHFLRAPLFKTDLTAMCSDTERTRRAIRALREGLALSLGMLGDEAYPDLLGPACVRYAEQVAVSRAKRLIHGSLSPSNIALGGAILDFGMASAVSDYGRIIIARNCPDAWHQHLPLLNGIEDLTHCVDKYSGEGVGHLALMMYLKQVFSGVMQERFLLELLKMSGIPEAVLRTIPQSDLREISEVYCNVASEGCSEPFKLLCPCPYYQPQMPDKMGRYHLGTCLKSIAFSSTAEEAEQALRCEIDDVSLRSKLVASTWKLRERFLGDKLGERRDSAIDYVRINAVRVNSNLPMLYSYQLNRNIDEALSDGSVSALVRNVVRTAGEILSEPNRGGVTFTCSDVQLAASEAHGATVNGVPTRWSDLKDYLRPIVS